jgi:2-keto-4-pentenoate hydratase/2-oxohepta-3-ene-1,7-dioic acid hydratase in catechol pathway
VDGNVVDLPKAAKAAGVKDFPTTMLELLDANALSAAKQVLADPKAQRAVVAPLNKVKLLAPLPNPRNVLALAGNYADHIREGRARLAPLARRTRALARDRHLAGGGCIWSERSITSGMSIRVCAYRA